MLIILNIIVNTYIYKKKTLGPRMAESDEFSHEMVHYFAGSVAWSVYTDRNVYSNESRFFFTHLFYPPLNTLGTYEYLLKMMTAIYQMLHIGIEM